MKRILFGTLLAFALAAQAGIGQTLRVHVKGMVCSFCAQGLTKKLSEQPAVQKSSVSLENKTVDVTLKEGGELSDEKLKQIVEDAGFHVEKIVR